MVAAVDANHSQATVEQDQTDKSCTVSNSSTFELHP